MALDTPPLAGSDRRPTSVDERPENGTVSRPALRRCRGPLALASTARHMPRVGSNGGHLKTDERRESVFDGKHGAGRRYLVPRRRDLATRRICAAFAEGFPTLPTRKEQPMYPTRNDLPATVRQHMVELCNARLADAIDLQTQTKQAHWNVKGPHFISLHEL